MYVCVYVSMNACMYEYMNACIYVCMYECTYEYMFVCIYMNVFMHVCMYIFMFLCMHVWIQVCAHAYEKKHRKGVSAGITAKRVEGIIKGLLAKGGKGREVDCLHLYLPKAPVKYNTGIKMNKKERRRVKRNQQLVPELRL